LHGSLESLEAGRLAEAEQEALAVATRTARTAPRAWLVVADSRQRRGRHAAAIEAYRLFLASCTSARLRRYALEQIRICREALSPRQPLAAPSTRLTDAERKHLAEVERALSIESTDHFVVRARNSALAKLIAGQAERNLSRICGVILAGQEFPHSVDVYVWPDQTEYRRHAIEAPEWAGGSFSVTARDGVVSRRIDLTQRGEDGRFAVIMLDRVLPHELCHLVIHEYFGDSHCPLFLSEGLAMLAELEIDNVRVLLAGLAVAGRAKIPLSRLFRIEWNTMETPALFYAESYSFVCFLHDRLTRGQFREFLSHVKDGCDAADALGRASYLPHSDQFLADVASAWEEHAIAQAQTVQALNGQRDPRGRN
jgi:hypothetical protein